MGGDSGGRGWKATDAGRAHVFFCLKSHTVWPPNPSETDQEQNDGDGGSKKGDLFCGSKQQSASIENKNSFKYELKEARAR